MLSRVPRAGVVQQHAAVVVADEHALVELGNQRREPRALGLDACLRVGNRAVDIVLKLGADAGEIVDRFGDRGHLGRHRHNPVRGIAVGDQAHRFGDTVRAVNERCEQAVREVADHAREHEREKDEQPDARRRHHRFDHRALVVREVGPQDRRTDGDERERGRRNDDRREPDRAHGQVTGRASREPWRPARASRTAW